MTLIFASQHIKAANKWQGLSPISPSPVAKQWAGARSGKVDTGFPSDRALNLIFRSPYQVGSGLIVIYVAEGRVRALPVCLHSGEEDFCGKMNLTH